MLCTHIIETSFNPMHPYGIQALHLSSIAGKVSHGRGLMHSRCFSLGTQNPIFLAVIVPVRTCTSACTISPSSRRWPVLVTMAVSGNTPDSRLLAERWVHAERRVSPYTMTCTALFSFSHSGLFHVRHMA